MLDSVGRYGPLVVETKFGAVLPIDMPLDLRSISDIIHKPVDSGRRSQYVPLTAHFAWLSEHTPIQQAPITAAGQAITCAPY